MENQADNTQGEKPASGFKAFATKRIIVAAVLIIAVVWALGIGLDIFGRSGPMPGKSPMQQPLAPQGVAERQPAPLPAQSPDTNEMAPDTSEDTQHAAAESTQSGHTTETATQAKGGSAHPGATITPSDETPAQQGLTSSQSHIAKTQTSEEAIQASKPDATPQHAAQPRGAAFVDAVIQPMDYELNKRFWGWRPNDIINFTDNINNFQLGVLEVTRRTTIMLSERISRTGSTDRLNPHLEDAANWLMVTATRYWFPSPESKYKECIKELEAYKQELIKGNASFYIRADNLIPLLASYEDLLGSCDENLVKQKNEDGSNISWFKADDFFFYAKGVAGAMATILEAIHHDFLPTLENRHGAELLHHALLSCRQASALSPLLITDTDLDGIFANHRANMAAPISHARFYIGQLIKTLST